MIWKHRRCSDQTCQLRGRAAEMGEGCVPQLQGADVPTGEIHDPGQGRRPRGAERFGMIKAKQILLCTATTEPLSRSVRRSQF